MVVTGEWCHEVLEDYLLETYFRRKDEEEDERNRNSGVGKKNSSAYSAGNEDRKLDDDHTDDSMGNRTNRDRDLNSNMRWSDYERFQFQGPGSNPRSLFGGRGVQYHLGFHHTDTCRCVLPCQNSLCLFFSSESLHCAYPLLLFCLY